MINRESPNARSAPLDALEFEVTDLGDARHALDDLPAGIGRAETLKPGYWEGRRRASRPTDRALAGATVEWAIALPAEVRPRELGTQFPRLANAIAAAWPNQELAIATLDKLLIDERGGRRGLPQSVQAELMRLQDFLVRGTASFEPAVATTTSRAAAPRPQPIITPDMLERAKRLLEEAGYRVIAPGG